MGKLVYLIPVMALLLVSFDNCDGFRALNSDGLSSLSANIYLRRLTNDEINKSLTIILQDSVSHSETFLPADATTPFDNDVATQDPSAPLIQGLDNFASDATQRLLADSVRKASVLGCAGSSVGDQSCMTNIVTKLGRLFFRRPLSSDEVSTFVTFGMQQAAVAGTFDGGVELVIRTFIQHPGFIYRMENNVILNNFEVASRLSFFIWGSGPDDALIKLAESGQLSTPSQVRQAATNMLSSSRAAGQIEKLHAYWLGYSQLSTNDSVSAAMKQEADTLVKRIVVDEQKPWQDIFTTTQTTISSVMGDIYGISGLTTTPTLVNFPANRQGLLSTGAFMSVAPKFGDTSPTQRGKFVMTRLLCQVVPPPPPSSNVDSPPSAVAGQPNCKVSRYSAHAQQGTSCFACHNLMDPIGFGLEQFDTIGKFRQYDYNPDGTPNTACPITGNGVFGQTTSFNGPTGLSQLLINSNQFQNCFVQQVYHFGMGKAASPEDVSFISGLQSEFDKTGMFNDLVLAFVTSDRFLRR